MASKSDIALPVGPKPAKMGSQESGEWVYQQIMDAVLEQRLAPGTKLGEELLSEIFEVSRPVVRWALTRLTHEKVVQMWPHRGAFVARPSVEQARQVFESRRVIEEAVVRKCSRLAPAPDLDRLVEHVTVEKKAAQKGDRARWIRLSGEFHIQLSRLADNDVLSEFLEDLVAQTSLIIRLYGNSQENVCGDDFHERIVAAIKAGDEDLAVRLMREHLIECESNLNMTENESEPDLRAIFSQKRHVRNL